MNSVKDIKLFEFPEFSDCKGNLVVIEGNKNIPFNIKRLFYIYGSDNNIIRGQHANKYSEFCFINIKGSSKIKIIDCYGKEDIINLNKPNIGLYLPAMIWKDMFDFSSDSILLVLASEFYDNSEYIRNFDDFIKG